MDQAAGSLTPASLAMALCLGLLVLALPRRYALAPLLAAGCYMTFGQALVIGGLHLYLIRILIVFGIVRVVARREIFAVQPRPIDGVLLLWLLVSSLLYVLADGRYVSVAERLGYMYDALGIYALARVVIRDLDDATRNVAILGLLILPLAALFAVESVTGHNVFAALGGVPAVSEVRNGHTRCQGPFKHSILAGTFGATTMPLFVGLWVRDRRNRLLASGAIAAAILIVFASRSSGPFSAFFLGMVGLACWWCKSQMRLIRWGIVAMFVALAVVMKAPVWFLIDRTSDLLGGDGWYRSQLLDSAIRHFGEWWLVGTGYTKHWMETGITANPYSADIVNEFVNQGIRGGMLALSLFIWLLARCFKTTGTAVRRDGQVDADRFMIWSMGCTVLAHVASFFSVSYFDQITIFWYLVIAMLVAVGTAERAADAVPRPVMTATVTRVPIPWTGTRAIQSR